MITDIIIICITSLFLSTGIALQGICVIKTHVTSRIFWWGTWRLLSGIGSLQQLWSQPSSPTGSGMLSELPPGGHCTAWFLFQALGGWVKVNNYFTSTNLF